MRYDFNELSQLLEPRSVAIIGASADPTRIGGRPIATMLKAGYGGRILPVNPNRDEIQGLTCYSDIEALPEAPEAAIVAVPARAAVDVVDALGRQGCKMVTMFTAGFAELGREGRGEQDRLTGIARQYGMRLLGPNTLGCWNVDIGYFGSFTSSLDLGFPLAGNIGMASQSGAFGTHLAAVARRRGIGVPILVTTGNEADITVADAIGWMAQSDRIDVICAYQEGFSDPDRMLAALNAARGADKPVFILKSGRSEVGGRAATSHTASMTGDDAVANEVLRAHGAIRVCDTEQMLDFAYVARKRIYPVENSLGVVTVSGGAGIVASDEAEQQELPMPPMPEDAQAELRALLPFCAPVNPVDCTAQALNDLSLFQKFTHAALVKGGYASVICFATTVAGSATIAPRFLEALAPLRKEFPDRLIVICAVAPPDIVKRYEDAGFLVFEDPCRATRALAAMGRVGKALTMTAPVRQAVPKIPLPPTTPDEFQAKALLSAAGIQVSAERLVHDSERASDAAQEIGFPVVMKIVSPDILHKSDIGGVMLNIGSSEEAASAYNKLIAAAQKHRPDARISGVLVARQITGGVECFMGISRDPSFGAMAAFGLGGIFVELLHDIALRQCPFDEAAAREMILSIRGAPILTGARGRAPVDLDALARSLSCLSVFAAGAGARLVSVDLNPVLALPEGEGAVALDAVIELEEAEP
ncbi:acetate--CoA ligase family protein [Paracoccus onubensis]|uniref:acetate--CoA ligase family protein n=1 Tax=Paracoccus onubensis TaxID=1675788 RepID=UPI0027311827|nr:acetate--CoA ligase family protein [Paracoccus onubensis]MDP0927385.1 acetate--CoA ligase family protein [Paracoccus onubensis]